MFKFTAKRASNDQKANPGAALAPGYYPAIVKDAIQKVSRNGNPVCEMTLEVDPGAPQRTVDVKMFLTLTTKAAFKVEQYLAATGVEFAAGQDLQFDTRAQLGKRLHVKTCLNAAASGALYPAIMLCMRKDDCPLLGAIPEEEYPSHGLNADGTSYEAAPAKKAAPAVAPAPSVADMAEDDIPF